MSQTLHAGCPRRRKWGNGEKRRLAVEAFTFLYINVVWLLAGFLNGVTSFGGNLFAVPLMTLVMETKEAIIFSCLVGTSITVSISVLYHHDLPKKEFLLALLASAAGVPFGLAALKLASPQSILIGSGMILLLFLIWQVVAGRLHCAFRVPVWSIIPAGVLAGLLMGATGMGGPMLAMYAVLRGWSKEVTLSMLNTLAALSMIFLIILQWKDGLYTPDMLRTAVWAVPCCVIGVLVSVPLIRRLNPHVFRLLLLGMLVFSMLMLFARGAGF